MNRVVFEHQRFLDWKSGSKIQTWYYFMFTGFGKTLIFFGAILILVGAFLLLVGKVPFLGKLPGDIHIQKKGFDFYFPLGTSILLSIVIFLILFLLNIFSKK